MAVKRKLEGPAKGSIASMLARMASDYGVQAQTAEQYSDSFKYLRFVDPYTGLPSIAHEYLLQASGFRAGTINQLRGLRATGKSSFCMLEYAACRRSGNAFCAHVETEGAGMQKARVAQFGIDPAELAVPRGVMSFESVLEFIDTFRCIIRGGDGGSVNDLGRKSATKFKVEDAEDPECTRPILIGVDSLSALDKEEETHIDIVDGAKTDRVAWMAQKMRSWFPKRSQVFERDLLTLFLTTHATMKISTGPVALGPPEMTSRAGNAIEQYDTVAIDFAKKDWKDKSGGVIGTEMMLKTFKNKIGREGKRISLFMTKDRGFDMIHTDAEFLLGKNSPFADGAGLFKGSRLCYRHSAGITCSPLSSRSFRTEEEFVRAFYENKDMLDYIRDSLRIYGYGLPHEDKYKPQFKDGMFVGNGTSGAEPQSDASEESVESEEPEQGFEDATGQ